MGALRDLRGQVFGRLTAISRVPGMWLCSCSCGASVAVHTTNLIKGLTRSCGCFRRERARQLGQSRETHGHTKSGKTSAEFRAWRVMRARCYVKDNVSYPEYGARGITVCAAWRESFEAFFLDVGQKPSPRHSLDRLDNNGNYEPGNVRWATAIEQQGNRRSTRWLTFRGERKTLTAWARALGIPASRVYNRLARGWSEEMALQSTRGILG